MLSSNSNARSVKSVNAVKSRKSRGLLQGIALLGLSTVGALTLTGHTTAITNLAAGKTASGNGSAANSGSTTSASPSASTSTASGSKTATGSAVNYRFGTVQLSVTKSNGKLTAINLVQAGATNGREQAFSYLVNDALSANGSSFGNMSGATYTTDAFKQALDSAISKL